MLIEPNGEELTKKVRNSYELVCVISKRARQLTNGVNPMMSSDSNSKITIASLEFERGLYGIKNIEERHNERNIK